MPASALRYAPGFMGRGRKLKWWTKVAIAICLLGAAVLFIAGMQHQGWVW